MKTQIMCRCLMTGVLWAAAAAVQADVWRLEPQGDWQLVSDGPGQERHPGLARVREALIAGGRRDVVKALEALKRDHPELAGGDLDAFIKAEEAYAKGNIGKAGKLYKAFLDKWPDSIYQPTAMERYFSIGAAFLQGQKRVFLGFLPLPAFDDGVDIMRRISDMAGNSPIALRALQVTAENQERRKKFMDAYHTWAEISVRWPTGAEGRDALLRMGRTLHAAYDGPDYDVTVLAGAQSYFEDFTARYPQVADDIKLDETLDQIVEQVAYKHYEVGFYYERLGNQFAAEQHYNIILSRWPGTTAAQKVAKRLGPEPEPARKPTPARALFNACTGFLDNWFGFQSLFGADASTDPSSNES